MKLMRQFISDGRIHKALDEVEAWLGYEIKAVPMPDKHRANATCMMRLNNADEFELCYIEEEPQSQATYFHELTHAIQWISGDPARYTICSVPLPRLFEYAPIRIAWSLVQHVPVWALVKEMGFDESEANNPCLLRHLIPAISQDYLHSDMPTELITPFQAVELAFGLSCPATVELRSNLRDIAKRVIPKALALAEPIVLAFEKEPQLSAQGHVDALRVLLDLSKMPSLLRMPTENLKALFLDKTYQDLRSRVLAAALDSTCSCY